MPPRPARLLRRAAPTVARVVAALVVGTLALIAGSTAAGAHAELLSSTPADGTVLERSPTTVTLTFSESVTVNLRSVQVLDEQGDRVDKGDADHTGSRSQVQVHLRPDLPDGTYTVGWRVISADSHPVRGGFIFSVGSPSGAEVKGILDRILNGGDDTGLQVVAGILRFVAYAGGLLAAGAAAYLVVADTAVPDPTRTRRLRSPIALGAMAALLAGVLGLPVQAALGTGLGVDSVFTGEVLRQVLGDGVGLSLLAVAAGAVLLVLALRRSEPAWPLLGAGALAVLAAFVLTGHSRVTAPVWLATTADAAHVAAGAVWFGGLAALLADLRHHAGDDEPDQAVTLVARFSGLAGWALAGVVAAGVVLSWLEVRVARGLTTTAYGRVLLAKVGVAALVALVAGINRYRLVPAVRSRPDAPARWTALRRAVGAEVVGLVVVLGLTAALVNLVPARTAAGYQSVYSTSATLGDGRVDLTLDPATAGTNTLHLYLLDAGGGQLPDPKSVRLQFRMPANDLGPITRTPFKAGPGHFQLRTDALSIPGTWTVTVLVRVDEFTEERATADLEVHP